MCCIQEIIGRFNKIKIQQALLNCVCVCVCVSTVPTHAVFILAK